MTTPITKEHELRVFITGFLTDPAHDERSKNSLTAQVFRIALAAMDAEPVADVVAWHKEGEERTCDIRWRRFDVAPGPLFAVAQPAPVVPDEMAISDNMNLYQKSFAQGHNACRAAMLQAGNSPEIPESSEDTKRLDWLDSQNKRLNEYYGTSYGWKFDANFQRNAMMLNDSNYPVMTVRQAIDQAIAAAPQQEGK
ncbi:hypothetical protein ACLB3Z_05910 [Escherichia coli]